MHRMKEVESVGAIWSIPLDFKCNLSFIRMPISPVSTCFYESTFIKKMNGPNVNVGNLISIEVCVVVDLRTFGFYWYDWYLFPGHQVFPYTLTEELEGRSTGCTIPSKTNRFCSYDTYVVGLQSFSFSITLIIFWLSFVLGRTFRTSDIEEFVKS